MKWSNYSLMAWHAREGGVRDRRGFLGIRLGSQIWGTWQKEEEFEGLWEPLLAAIAVA